MSFKTLIKKIKRPTDTYILQKKQTYQSETKIEYIKDEIGNIKEIKKTILKDKNNKIINKDKIGNNPEEYEDVIELQGVIQHDQKEKITNAGEESKVIYKGYFLPTFDIDTNTLSDYRIKFIRNKKTLFLKIIRYDPNNYLRANHHHIEVKLQEDKKYNGRQ